MSGNYEIEEMVHQDDLGVVFEASGPDGTKAALHRFFLPEKTLAHYAANPEAFTAALDELQTLSSATLRPVIAGGIDPADRTPWVALPWLDGRTLASVLGEKGSLTEVEALAVWSDGNQAIRHLGVQARQISLDPQDIIVTTTDGQPAASYMIAIRRWFLTHAGTPLEAPEPLPILTDLYRSLTDDPPVRARPPSRHPKLATGVPAAPRAAPGLSTRPKRPAPLASAKTSGSSWPLAVSLILLLALGGGTWFYMKDRSSQPAVALTENSASAKPKPAAKPTPAPEAPNPDQPAGPEVVLATTTQAGAPAFQPEAPEDPETEEPAEIIDVAPAPMEPVSPVLDLPEGHFRPDNHAAITARMGKEITLVGIVEGVGESTSGKTLRLTFGWGPKIVNAQAILSKSEGLSRDLLEVFKTKRVALTGTVTRDFKGDAVLEFNSIADLQIVDP